MTVDADSVADRRRLRRRPANSKLQTLVGHRSLREKNDKKKNVLI